MSSMHRAMKKQVSDPQVEMEMQLPTATYSYLYSYLPYIRVQAYLPSHCYMLPSRLPAVLPAQSPMMTFAVRAEH